MTAAFSFTDDEYRGHTAALENQLNMLRSRDVDSRTLYGTTARGWTLWSGDRRAAQRRLVQDLWQQLSATVPREAKAMLVAGVDGAGKTTMRSDRSNGFTADRYFVIDPDEIDSGVFEAVAGSFEGQGWRSRSARCGSPEIVEGFLSRFGLRLVFPDLIVDG